MALLGGSTASATGGFGLDLPLFVASSFSPPLLSGRRQEMEFRQAQPAARRLNARVDIDTAGGINQMPPAAGTGMGGVGQRGISNYKKTPHRT